MNKDSEMKQKHINDIIPKARGEAEKKIQEAEAYKKKLLKRKVKAEISVSI